MLTKLIPETIKARIRRRIRAIASQYYPSYPQQNDYCIDGSAVSHTNTSGTDMPVPPEDLWVGYGQSAEDYLASGQTDVSTMTRVLAEGGFDTAKAKRILEFGCAAGRMIRHVPKVAPASQCWGTDISAEPIRWCRHNLSPRIHFAVTTTIPHLPFQDCFFDLVFCGSVFTHIEDLEESWLLELGRILSPSGRLYLTIHDECTVKLLDTRYRENALAKAMSQRPVYANNKHCFGMIVAGRNVVSQVFYNSGYLRSIVPPVFRWLSHVPEAYGYQSAVVLEKLRM